MRVTSRRLRQHLEHMGTAPVAPPSPGFAARTEEHLRTLRPLSAAEPVRPAPRLRVSRPVWVSVAMATAAAAAVVGLVAPAGQQRVVVTTGGPAATASTVPTTEATPPTAPRTTEPAPVTTAAPAPSATTVTTAPTRSRPTPTTMAVAPVPTTAPRAEASPATTTTRPSEPTTTTSAPPKIAVRLTCVAGYDPTSSFVVTCTWSAPADAALAGWRLHRAVGANPKVVAFSSSDPAALSWVDEDVVQGGVYRYALEALAGDGRTIAKSAIVEVACCTV